MPHTVEVCWGCHQIVHQPGGKLIATVEVNRDSKGVYRYEIEEAEKVANIIRQVLDEAGLG